LQDMVNQPPRMSSLAEDNCPGRTLVWVKIRWHLLSLGSSCIAASAVWIFKRAATGCTFQVAFPAWRTMTEVHTNPRQARRVHALCWDPRPITEIDRRQRIAGNHNASTSREHMPLWSANTSSAFNSLFRVLFTVPSMYLCAIGHASIFSLCEDTLAHICRVTMPSNSTHRAAPVGDITPAGITITGLSPCAVRAFQTHFHPADRVHLWNAITLQCNMI